MFIHTKYNLDFAMIANSWKTATQSAAKVLLEKHLEREREMELALKEWQPRHTRLYEIPLTFSILFSRLH